MKKALVIFGLTVWVLMAFAACGGGKQEVKSDEPEVLLPGEFVESVDANTDMVRCQGKGADQPAAILQARKACLEWYINEKLCQSPEERNAYLAKQKEVLAKLDRYVKEPEVGSRLGKGEGVKSSRRIDDYTTLVAVNTKVFRDQLQKDLVGMGVMKSKDELLAGAGNPSIMVVPFAASKKNANRNAMEHLLATYLTKNQWEVRSLEGSEDVDKMTAAMGEATGSEDDEAAAAAAAAGADVYVKFEGKKKVADDESSVAYMITLEARETTTKRMLASEKVTGEAYPTGKPNAEDIAMDTALSDAMGKVLPQITNYWREDSAKGNKFWITFENAPKNTDVAMNGVLKKSCTLAKLEQTTATMTKFFAQCKMDSLELVGALDEGITAKLGGAAYNKNISKAVIQIVFTK